MKNTPSNSLSPAAGQAAHTPIILRTHAHDRFVIYKFGKFGCAYNPNTRRWEVYEFADVESGEIIDLIDQLQRKCLAVADAIDRNQRAALALASGGAK